MPISPNLKRSLIAGTLVLTAGLGIQGALMAQAPSPATASPAAPSSAAAKPMTRSAVQAEAERRFTALDTNKDGVLSPEERKAAVTAEMKERSDRMFADMDKDGNGSISRAEFDAARLARPGGRHFRAGHDRKGPGMAGRYGGPRPDMGARADTNASVTKADFVNRRLAMFDRRDSNKDGTISPNERGTFRGKGLAPAGTAPGTSSPPPAPGG